MHDQLTLSIDEFDELTQQRLGLFNKQQQFQYLIACVEDQLELQEQLQFLSGCEQTAERLEEMRSLESRHKLLIEEELKDSNALADVQEDFKIQSNLLNNGELQFNSMDNDQITKVLQDVPKLQQNQENLDFRQREITRETERLDNLYHRRQSQKIQARIQIIGGVVAWTVAAATTLLAFIVELSVVLFLIGLLATFFSRQRRKQVKTLESQFDELSVDIENQKVEFVRRQQELADAQKVVEDLFERVGVSSSDELRAEYIKLQEQRQEVNQLKERVEESKDKLRRTQGDLQITERQLHKLISPALDSKEGSIGEQLALF